MVSGGMTLDLVRVVRDLWLTPGVSEFLAAVFGGSVTLGAQFIAMRHDRKKEAERLSHEKKAQAWAIFFKISEVHEALSAAAADLKEARRVASARKNDLWQALQFPPHDWNSNGWEIGELVFLLDKKQFGLMQRYQQATVWLSNLIQSTKYYRELRVEFLRNTPSDVQGTQGSIAVGPENRAALMPTIAHLRSLADSLEKVVLAQQPDARQLLIDYAAAMKGMIGVQPNLTFADAVDGNEATET